VRKSIEEDGDGEERRSERKENLWIKKQELTE
jgi:hypothetical protein